MENIKIPSFFKRLSLSVSKLQLLWLMSAKQLKYTLILYSNQEPQTYDETIQVSKMARGYKE